MSEIRPFKAQSSTLSHCSLFNLLVLVSLVISLLTFGGISVARRWEAAGRSLPSSLGASPGSTLPLSKADGC